MQDAIHPDQGSMLAILGMGVDEVEQEISLLPQDEVCEISNDNSISQVVVSGKKTSIEILSNNLKKKRKKRNTFARKRTFSLLTNEKSRWNYER